MQISKAEKTLQQNDDVIIPFPESRLDRDAQYTVLYDKPQGINVVPSFAHDTDTEVELVLTMPSVRMPTTFPITIIDVYFEATLPR